MSGDTEKPNEEVVKEMKVRETLLDGTISTALKTTAIGVTFGFVLNKVSTKDTHFTNYD